MTAQEAFIKLRDDLKEWVTNNLNAIGKPKASDVNIEPIEGMAAVNVQSAFSELNTKKAQNIDLSSTASDQSNAPWKVIKAWHTNGSLPNGVCTSGKISCGSAYAYSGFHIGSYGSWLVHCYVTGQVYHVILTNNQWKYETVSVGNATSF